MDNQPAPPAQRQNISLPTVLLLGATLLCLILLAGGAVFYYSGPCGVNRVRTAGLALADQAQAYIDTYDVAAATPRYALSGPILDLRELKRETELVPVPACIEGARYELVQMIENGTQGFIAFMNQDDYLQGFYFDESANHMAEFQTQLELVEQCKPFCRVE